MSSGARHYMSKKQRACDACRIRKRACRIDGTTPCDFCFRFGKQCVFTDSTNRRKPKTSEALSDSVATVAQLQPGPPGSYRSPDRLHESPSGVSQRPLAPPDMVDSELNHFDAELQDFVMTDFDSHTFFGLSHEQFGDAYNFHAHEDGLGGSNDSPNDPQALFTSTEQAPASASYITLDAGTISTSQFIGHTSDMDPHLLQLYRYDASRKLRFKKLTIQALEDGQLPVQFLLSDRMKLASTEDDFSKELEDIVPAQNGDRLIMLFQKYVARQYPIFGEPPSAKSAPSYLLAATYLTVQPYISFDEQLCIELAYEGLPRQQLLDLFYHSLGQVVSRPSVATVQALFLMVVCPGDPLIFEGPSRWTMFGTLVSCAQTIGLHLDPTAWNLAPSQAALRRTLSALIYSTDKLLAAGFGKPPLLRPDNWLVTRLSQDSPNAHLIRPGLALHIESSGILERTLKDLYSLRAISELGADPWTTLDRARPLLEELKAWHRTFTSTCKDHALSSPASADSSSASAESATDLHVYELGYHFMRVLILRAVFRPFINQVANASDPRFRVLSSTAEPRQNARLGIRACATDALNYVRSLRQEEATYTFWPPWASGVISSLCYLLLLMVATADDYNDAAEWLRELQALRMELRVKSAGLPVLRLGLLRIDSIFWKDVSNVLVLPDHVVAALQDARNEGS